MFLYKQQYYDKIGDPIKDKEKFKSALATALDIRKFEIDLYWKRSQYFWAFTSIAFGAYGYAWNLAKDNPKFAWLPFGFSIILLLISINWYLVVRGSKFWQDNWERHVDILEDIVHGPIYKTVIIVKAKDEGKFSFNSAPISVSKVNQSVCAFLYFISMLLFLRESVFMLYHLATDYTLKNLQNALAHLEVYDNFAIVVNIVTISIVVILVLAFFVILNCKCYSDFGNYKVEKEKIECGTIKLYEREIRIRD